VEPTHITLSKDFIDEMPSIRSRFLTSTLLAIKSEDRKWSVQKI
jgi:hypothetical protein